RIEKRAVPPSHLEGCRRVEPPGMAWACPLRSSPYFEKPIASKRDRAGQKIDGLDSRGVENRTIGSQELHFLPSDADRHLVQGSVVHQLEIPARSFSIERHIPHQPSFCKLITHLARSIAGGKDH